MVEVCNVEVYRRTLQVVECLFGLVPPYNMWHHVVTKPFIHVMVGVDEYDEEAEIHCIHSYNVRGLSGYCRRTNAFLISRSRSKDDASRRRVAQLLTMSPS